MDIRKFSILMFRAKCKMKIIKLLYFRYCKDDDDDDNDDDDGLLNIIDILLILNLSM
jgi:hypothetical protein